MQHPSTLLVSQSVTSKEKIFQAAIQRHNWDMRFFHKSRSRGHGYVLGTVRDTQDCNPPKNYICFCCYKKPQGMTKHSIFTAGLGGLQRIWVRQPYACCKANRLVGQLFAKASWNPRQSNTIDYQNHHFCGSCCRPLDRIYR